MAGAYMLGGVHGGEAWQGGHVWQGGMNAMHTTPPPTPQILQLRHTVNEQMVRILLKCIPVLFDVKIFQWWIQDFSEGMPTPVRNGGCGANVLFGQIFLKKYVRILKNSFFKRYVFFLFSDVWSQNESFSFEAGRQKNGENKRLVHKQGSVNH